MKKFSTNAHILTLHPRRGSKRKAEIVTSDAAPDIGAMELPDWVSYVDLLSETPVDYVPRPRKNKEALPTYQTLYFPHAEVFDAENLFDAAANEVELLQYHDIALQGISFDYHFAGGPSLSRADPGSTEMILTQDHALFAFAANCFLLQPAYHGEDGMKNPGRRWDKITRAAYRIGAYNNS